MLGLPLVCVLAVTLWTVRRILTSPTYADLEADQ